MRPGRALATIALAAAAAACDASPTTVALAAGGGPAAAQSPGVLTFASTQSYTARTPQTAGGGPAGIDFAGSLTTGTPCYTLSATHTTSGTSVTVTVTATQTGQVCVQVVTHNNYTGRVSALLPGTYDFTVLHVYRGTTTTAWSGPVTVR